MSYIGAQLMKLKRRRALVGCAADEPRFWETTRQINTIARTVAKMGA